MRSDDRCSKECCLGVSPWFITFTTLILSCAFVYYVYNAPFWQMTDAMLLWAVFFLLITLLLGYYNERSVGSPYRSVALGDFQAVSVKYSDSDVGNDTQIQLQRVAHSESDSTDEEAEKKFGEESESSTTSHEPDNQKELPDLANLEGEDVGFEEFVFEDREYDPPDNEARIILIINGVVITCIIALILLYSLRLAFVSHQGLVIASLGANINGTQKVLLRCPHGKLAETVKEKDWTISLLLDSLEPSTNYAATLTCNHEKVHLRWKTLPSAGTSGKFSFAFGSCLLPRPWQERQGLHSVVTLGADFFLFLGDFIYTDHPQWILPASKDMYERHYRDVFADKYVAAISHSLPSFYMYDDHDVYNNWEGYKPNQISDMALNVYSEYLGATNPDPLVKGAHYYSFDVADASFFVMDTRFYRTEIKLSEKSSILGSVQLRRVLDWLQSSQSTFKFLVSPVPVTDRTLSMDSWYAYGHERDLINDFIMARNISGVVWISADRHWSGMFELKPGIYEFSSSPLDAFWSEEEVGNHKDVLYFSNAKRHVGHIEIDTTVTPPQLTMQSFESKTSKLLLSTVFKPSTVGLSIVSWKTK